MRAIIYFPRRHELFVERGKKGGLMVIKGRQRIGVVLKSRKDGSYDIRFVNWCAPSVLRSLFCICRGKPILFIHHAGKVKTLSS